LLPVAACSAPSPSDEQDPDAPVIGCPPAANVVTDYDPTAILKYGSVPASSLDPIRQVEANEITVLQTIYDPLVKLNEKDEPVPGLATEWKTVGADTMEFTLRTGVKFQDGTPFDAEAVKFNVDRAKTSPDSTIKADLANVKSVEVVDADTVRFKLDPPNPAALPLILSDRAGLMASPTAVQAAGTSQAFSAAPVGAGPYKIEGEWFSRERVSVRAWDGYWNAAERKLGGIDFIETSTDASLPAVQAGDLDIQYIEDGKVDAACADSRLRVYSTPSNEIRVFIINQSMPPFDNLKVRQALYYALDRQGIADALTGGKAEAATGFFPKGSIAYSPELENAYPYDPEKAKQLLAEAGYPDGITFTAETGTSFTAYITMGELIQAQLKESGINMELQLIDPATTLARLYGNATTPPAMAASPLAFPPARQPSARLRDRFLSDGRYNPSDVEISGIRDLIDKADAATDPAERADYFQQAAKLASDQAAAGVPLFFVTGHSVFGSYVGGVKRGSTRSNMIFDGLYITKGRVPVDGVS
jgi:peptide/nickel transport system substrate-binding protein